MSFLPTALLFKAYQINYKEYRTLFEAVQAQVKDYYTKSALKTNLIF